MGGDSTDLTWSVCFVDIFSLFARLTLSSDVFVPPGAGSLRLMNFSFLSRCSLESVIVSKQKNGISHRQDRRDRSDRSDRSDVEGSEHIRNKFMSM